MIKHWVLCVFVGMKASNNQIGIIQVMLPIKIPTHIHIYTCSWIGKVWVPQNYKPFSLLANAGNISTVDNLRRKVPLLFHYPRFLLCRKFIQKVLFIYLSNAKYEA
eukprot:TRINITY_DN8581_c1_g1_i1.p1 TRINITY_DN8581_c1_g1~~TRINITY_DN8581_c1_g1_i1.p1  ORF type:complete len:106 (+),score=0.78 TRINITY_DN8581_c1_g1_i1:2909-3226(+)